MFVYYILNIYAYSLIEKKKYRKYSKKIEKKYKIFRIKLNLCQLKTIWVYKKDYTKPK